MAHSIPCEVAAPPATALAAALLRTRRRFTRTLTFIVLLCLGIGLLLTAIEGRALGSHFVYSLCIGFTCMAVTDGARLTAAWASDRLRAARHLPASTAGFESGWRGIAPAAAAALLVGPPLGLSLGDWLTGYHSPSLFSLDASSTRFTLVMSLLGTLISVFVLSTMERLSNARAQAEAAQRLAAENQLRLLQSQLEPHMLFNTLANLRVLIGMDAGRAQAMLDHLIAFLRATLEASRSASQPLAAEFAHLRDYLALMAVRMGPRLAVTLDLPPELVAVPVPPLLLQPLVENAIKHGLEPKVEGGRIAVGARREGGLLRLTVRDTGVGLGGTGETGTTGGTAFGLEQVRTRLAALYGSGARLDLQAATDGEGGALATVAIPMAAPT